MPKHHLVLTVTRAQGTIDHPEGAKRYAAHVFYLRSGGIAWEEPGWTEPYFSDHAVHVLEERLDGFMPRVDAHHR